MDVMAQLGEPKYDYGQSTNLRAAVIAFGKGLVFDDHLGDVKDSYNLYFRPFGIEYDDDWEDPYDDEEEEV